MTDTPAPGRNETATRLTTDLVIHALRHLRESLGTELIAAAVAEHLTADQEVDTDDFAKLFAAVWDRLAWLGDELAKPLRDLGTQPVSEAECEACNAAEEDDDGEPDEPREQAPEVVMVTTHADRLGLNDDRLDELLAGRTRVRFSPDLDLVALRPPGAQGWHIFRCDVRDADLDALVVSEGYLGARGYGEWLPRRWVAEAVAEA